jgi:hypothetical protein
MSRWTRLIAAATGAGLAASLGACATQPEASPPAAAPPAWFDAAAAQAATGGFPDLADVPAAPRVAPASDPRWDALEQELVSEREALLAHERASPAPANADQEAQAFQDGAVRAIEATRNRY